VDLNAKLNWKQVVGIILLLYFFGRFLEQIEHFVLTHPAVGVAILAVLIIGWWVYHKKRRKPVHV